MAHYYITSTDYEVREFRALVNKVVTRMTISEGARAWRFQGYGEDGDAMFEADERIAPKLIEIANGLGAKVLKLHTEEMGKPVVVDRR